MRPDSRIGCVRLGATVSARCCVLRQRACDGAVTRDRWRGQSPPFPSCAGCPQGQAIRAEVGPQIPRAHGRPLEIDQAQVRARRRLRLVGLLDPVPTIDDPIAEDEAPEEAEAAPAALAL